MKHFKKSFLFKTWRTNPSLLKVLTQSSDVCEKFQKRGKLVLLGEIRNRNYYNHGHADFNKTPCKFEQSTCSFWTTLLPCRSAVTQFFEMWSSIWDAVPKCWLSNEQSWIKTARKDKRRQKYLGRGLKNREWLARDLRKRTRLETKILNNILDIILPSYCPIK